MGEWSSFTTYQLNNRIRVQVFKELLKSAYNTFTGILNENKLLCLVYNKNIVIFVFKQIIVQSFPLL